MYCTYSHIKERGRIKQKFSFFTHNPNHCSAFSVVNCNCVDLSLQVLELVLVSVRIKRFYLLCVDKRKLIQIILRLDMMFTCSYTSVNCCWVSGCVRAASVTTPQIGSRCACGTRTTTSSPVWSRSSNESPMTSSVKPSSRSEPWAERWTSGTTSVSSIHSQPHLYFLQ